MCGRRDPSPHMERCGWRNPNPDAALGDFSVSWVRCEYDVDAVFGERGVARAEVNYRRNYGPPFPTVAPQLDSGRLPARCGRDVGALLSPTVLTCPRKSHRESDVVHPDASGLPTYHFREKRHAEWVGAGNDPFPLP